MDGNIVVTVEEKVKLRPNGKEDRYTITRYKGLATYKTASGKEVLADEAAYFDHGSQGGGWCFSIHKDYTPEERAEGRRRIVETLTQVLIEQGVW